METLNSFIATFQYLILSIVFTFYAGFSVWNLFKQNNWTIRLERLTLLVFVGLLFNNVFLTDNAMISLMNPGFNLFRIQ